MVLTVKEFAEKVKESILDYLPESYKDAEVELKEVIKNNDTKLTGLIIRKQDAKIVPTVYLNEFFESFLMGENMEPLLVKIAEVYNKGLEEQPEDTDEICNRINNFENAKGMISAKLVNTGKNLERLEDMPHKDIEDLSIIFHLALGKNRECDMSVPLVYSLLNSYNITVEELKEIAFKNMKEQNPPVIKSLTDTILEMSIPNYDKLTEEEKAEAAEEVMGIIPDNDVMFVLTNSNKNFGAVWSVDKETMDQAREKLGDDFFVLPSSVHEVLLLPKKGNIPSVNSLREMVDEVNNTQVADDEILSFNVYEYDDTNGIHIATGDNSEEKAS